MEDASRLVMKGAVLRRKAGARWDGKKMMNRNRGPHSLRV